MNGTAYTGSASLLVDPNFEVAATPDLNGDGKCDLLWQNTTTGQTVAWLMNGTMVIGSAALLTHADLKVIATPDLNGDGKSDLLWYNAATGETATWLMNGTAFTASASLLIHPNFKVIGTPDLNGDGKSDLLWYNASTDQTTAWLMNGAAYTAAALLLTHPEFKVMATPDFNGDGKSDLLWYNAATGQTTTWLMNGTAYTAAGSLLTHTDFKVIATPDLNGDGKSDLLWYNAATGQTTAWLMDGTGYIGASALLTHPDFKVVATPDLNGDGKADLLWYNATTGQTATWLMDGTSDAASAVLLTHPEFRPRDTLTQPPVAVPSFAIVATTAQAEVGAPLSFASSIPDGTIGLSYGWDFGDGTTSFEAKPTKVYTAPGTYVVNLTVVSSNGTSRAASTEVVAGRFSLTKGLRCTGTAANSGWCREPTLPIGGTPFFIDASRGWMNGSPGDFEGASGIYRTTDGGQTWTGHKTGAANFSSMNFADANNGIGITQNSVNAEGKRRQEIWGSSDGGQTWARRSTLPFALTLEAGAESKLFSLPFFASTDGKRVIFSGSPDGLTSLDGGVTWALTRFSSPTLTPGGTLWQVSGTQVLRSTDLGLTYSTTTLTEGGTLESLAFSGDLNGWINARDAAGNRSVWKTIDGGLNWTRTALAPPASPTHGGRLTSFGPSTVWLSRSDIVSSMTSISTDGGATWRRVFPPATPVDPSRLRPVVAIAEAIAWTRGEGCNSVFLTQDGGGTWATIQGPEDSGIPVAIGNPCEPKLLWPGGASATPLIQLRDRWYRSADGGVNWTQVLGMTSAQSVTVETPAVWFFDSLNGRAFDVATQDGGRTWTKQAVSPRTANQVPIFLRPRLQFNASGLLGWAVTDRSSFAMSRTTDGGQSWQRITMPAPASVNPIDFENADMHFADDRSGWIVRRRSTPFFAGGAQPALWSTANGGLDWVLHPQPPIAANAVHFISATTGFLAGEAGALAQTSDGGITWQLRATGVSTSLQRLFFFSPTLGFAVGEAGTLLRTTDGGATWAQTAVPTTNRLNNVHFADARTGWIVGNAGTLLASTDGGATWTAQRSGTVVDLVHLFAADASTAWVVDERGHTITTATGGRSP